MRLAENSDSLFGRKQKKPKHLKIGKMQKKDINFYARNLN